MRLWLVIICLFIKFNVGLTCDLTASTDGSDSNCNNNAHSYIIPISSSTDEFDLESYLQNIHWRIRQLVKDVFDNPNSEDAYNAVYKFWTVEENNQILLPELDIQCYSKATAPLFILQGYAYFNTCDKNLATISSLSALEKTADDGFHEGQYQLASIAGILEGKLIDQKKLERSEFYKKLKIQWLKQAKKNGNIKAKEDWAYQRLSTLTHTEIDLIKKHKYLLLIYNSDRDFLDKSYIIRILANQYFMGMGTITDWEKGHRCLEKARRYDKTQDFVVFEEKRFPIHYTNYVGQFINKTSYEITDELLKWVDAQKELAKLYDNPLAQYFLGLVYLGEIKNVSVKKDYEAAIRYLKMADKNNFSLASQVLAEIFVSIKAPLTKNPNVLLQHYKSAREHTIKASQYAQYKEEKEQLEANAANLERIIKLTITDVHRATNSNQTNNGNYLIHKNRLNKRRMAKTNNSDQTVSITSKKSKDDKQNKAEVADILKELGEDVNENEKIPNNINKKKRGSKKDQAQKRKHNQVEQISTYSEEPMDDEPLENENTLEPLPNTDNQVSNKANNIYNVEQFGISIDTGDNTGFETSKSRNSRKKEARKKREQEAAQLEQKQILAKEQAMAKEREKIRQQKQTQVNNQILTQNNSSLEKTTDQALAKLNSTTHTVANTAVSKQPTALKERNSHTVSQSSNSLNALAISSSKVPASMPTPENVNPVTSQQEQDDEPFVVIKKLKTSQTTPSNQQGSETTGDNRFGNENTIPSSINPQFNATWNGTKILSRPNQESATVDNTYNTSLAADKSNISLLQQQFNTLDEQLRKTISLMEQETEASKRTSLSNKIDNLLNAISEINHAVSCQNFFLIDNNVTLRQQNFNERRKEFPQYK